MRPQSQWAWVVLALCEDVVPGLSEAVLPDKLPSKGHADSQWSQRHIGLLLRQRGTAALPTAMVNWINICEAVVSGHFRGRLKASLRIGLEAATR